MIPIRYLSTQSNVKNGIIKKQNHVLGWIPHTDSYVMIQNSHCPSEPTILLQTSWEPESKLSNLPLSVFNLIHFADKIGATDDVLLQMLTCYLRKHKPTILESLDQRKNSLHAVIESLAFQCTTDAERATVQHKLRTFTRVRTESFATCYSRFESLHVFYLQLDQPSEADQIRLVSYNTLRAVTPYFISTKCAQA